MRSAAWYVNRLFLMSPGEMLYRFAHAARARTAGLFGPTPAPRAQAAVALPRWVPPPAVDPAPYVEAGERVLRGEAELFGEWRNIGSLDADWNRDPFSGLRAPLTHGQRLDLHDSGVVGDARVTLEMNRHFQLVALSQAWALTHDARFRQGAHTLIRSWLRSSPYPLGVNWTSPLEHGIRLINWYVAARQLALADSDFAAIDGWLESIYRHCDFIWSNQSRYSSANNHLIGEMAGLFIAASAWPCWEKSGGWRRRSKEILEREAALQVHVDGVTREQSVGYQMFVAQLLMLAGLVGESAGNAFSSDYWRTVWRMLTFLYSIRDAGGHLPDFGDSDEGAALLLAPDARATRAADLLGVYAAFAPSSPPVGRAPAVEWLLTGFPRPARWPSVPIERRVAFRDGGYFVLGRSLGEHDEAAIIFDAAPLGFLSIAAHGHADCLSFTLSVAGDQVLIDPGTYCYHGNPRWRDYFRSTAAHNTVRVDGVDQSEMVGPFMWARKAVPTVHAYEDDGNEARLTASHSGYLRLSDPVTHERTLELAGASSHVRVTDTLHCRRSHRAEQFWHFAETCVVRKSGASSVQVTTPNAVIDFEFDAAGAFELANGAEAPIRGWVSRRFGQRSPTTTIVISRECAATTTLATDIRWRISRPRSAARPGSAAATAAALCGVRASP